AREASPVFTTEKTPFRIGKAEVFRDGTDVAVIACGPLVHNALLAAEELRKEEKLDVMVVNCHTVKPLDAKTVIAAAKACGAVVTVEEHQIAGGLGGAVAECLAASHPTPMGFVGVKDRFGESGPPKDLIEHFGMGVASIKDAVRAAHVRKNAV
ncbi:transketolase family protein, partial [Candidatus Uhrbacteria bacterium]|nr:transketolase family protein [Candidatus Uhrbacteria bacterium]